MRRQIIVFFVGVSWLATLPAWANADQRALDALATKLRNDQSVTASFNREVLMRGRKGPLAERMKRVRSRAPVRRSD